MHPEFGVLFLPRDPAAVIAAAGLTELLGYDFVGLGDSQALAMDVWVALALVAAHTSVLRLGPCVTNPVTRDLSVTASAVASLDATSGGRAYLGLGSGNSAVRNAGLSGAATTSMTSVVPALRALLSGEPTVIGNRQVTAWRSNRAVPIHMAASGPTGLRVAGQVADGVILNVGVVPAIVRDAIACVHQGARVAGRRPADVTISVMAVASCAEDEALARESARGGVAGIASYALRADREARWFPGEMMPAVMRLAREYSVQQHMTAGTTSNAALAEHLGLTDYLLERFAVAGTPSQCRRRVDDLHAIGVDRVLFSLTASSNFERDATMLASALQIDRRNPRGEAPAACH